MTTLPAQPTTEAPAPVVGERDRYGNLCVAITEHWVVTIDPMIYNQRICLASHEEYGRTYTAGWCYPTFIEAVVAAVQWDPEAQVRPEGFLKEAYDARRGSLL